MDAKHSMQERPLLIGNEDLNPDLLDAWALFFADCKRIAEELRARRAIQAEGRPSATTNTASKEKA